MTARLLFWFFGIVEMGQHIGGGSVAERPKLSHTQFNCGGRG